MFNKMPYVELKTEDFVQELNNDPSKESLLCDKSNHLPPCKASSWLWAVHVLLLIWNILFGLTLQWTAKVSTDCRDRDSFHSKPHL
jgi:hypothetical protein